MRRVAVTIITVVLLMILAAPALGHGGSGSGGDGKGKAVREEERDDHNRGRGNDRARVELRRGLDEREVIFSRKDNRFVAIKIEGVPQSVNAAGRTITVKLRSGALRTVGISAQARLEKNDMRALLSDFHAGERVEMLLFKDTGLAFKMEPENDVFRGL